MEAELCVTAIRPAHRLRPLLDPVERHTEGHEAVDWRTAVGPAGEGAFARAVAIQANGRIVVAGFADGSLDSPDYSLTYDLWAAQDSNLEPWD